MPSYGNQGSILLRVSTKTGMTRKAALNIVISHVDDMIKSWYLNHVLRSTDVLYLFQKITLLGSARKWFREHPASRPTQDSAAALYNNQIQWWRLTLFLNVKLVLLTVVPYCLTLIVQLSTPEYRLQILVTSYQLPVGTSYTNCIPQYNCIFCRRKSEWLAS